MADGLGEPPVEAVPGTTRHRSAVRVAVRGVTTVVGAAVVWFALVGPDEIGALKPATFVRLPLEALIVAGGVVLLPRTAGRVVAGVVGVALGLLVILKFLDIASFEAINRAFNPEVDMGYLGSAVGVLSDSIGRTGAIAVVAAGALAAGAVLVSAPVSVLVLTSFLRRHHGATRRAVVALVVAWALCAVAGVQLVPGVRFASTSAARLAFTEVARTYSGIKDKRAFAAISAVDAFSDTPGADLLTGLRGKDVVFVFVESYGRVAVQGSEFSPQVDAVLDDGTDRLTAAGFSARSAFLTSPTFGGISWLAHSTLQSGLWIDNQQRYDDLVTSSRFTLSDAFKRAGWRTVNDAPADDVYWPQGTSFYHYDQLYNSLDVGYAGPKFSYAPVPDQYTLAALQRLELATPGHAPVMAEVDLVSSHTPWAPLPRMVDWSQLGDGSVFDPMPDQGQSASAVWQDPSRVRAAYGKSIEYSMSALVSFVETFQDDNLVLVVLGDHQPATIVSGQGASHDVPITVISHDSTVLGRIAPWGWQDGLRPGPDAPVWPMDAFRDRFLTAFGPQPPTTSPSAASLSGPRPG